MNEDMKFLSGGQKLLDRVSPLWEEIKKYHVEKSIHFSKEMDAKSFLSRKAELVSKSKYLRVDIAHASKQGKDIGYCISTIDDIDRGEIDSLFVLGKYRGKGVGKKLTERALTWLDEKGAVEHSICVASGNEEVLDFYQSFGFYPRGIYLARKQ